MVAFQKIQLEKCKTVEHLRKTKLNEQVSQHIERYEEVSVCLTGVFIRVLDSFD